jgi:hypothetical protein
MSLFFDDLRISQNIHEITVSPRQAWHPVADFAPNLSRLEMMPAGWQCQIAGHEPQLGCRGGTPGSYSESAKDDQRDLQRNSAMRNLKNSISVLALFVGINAFGATYCVGPASTGNGSGADWNNLKGWSSAPVRGDTWYLVDGTYAGRTFNTANSGTTDITIKKATVASHGGINTGWDNTLGDGQATIGALRIDTSYWTIDGQIGDGFSTQPVDSVGTHYGIYMNDGGGCVAIPGGTRNITLSHIYAPANTNSAAAAGGGWFIHDITGTSGSISNITISYCLLIGWGQAIRAGESGSVPWYNLLWEYNIYYWMYTSPTYHGNPINAMWADINYPTVRYSIFRSTFGSGGLSQVISANGAGWRYAKIYGNVFDSCWSGRAIISGNCVSSGGGIFNSEIYHNTFLLSASGRPAEGGGLAGDECSSGNIFQNNLAWNCRGAVNGGVSHDFNEYVYTTATPSEGNGVVISANYDPFVNYSGQYYTLKTNTRSGNTLASEFQSDALGNTRTTRTRGAFEYGSVGPNTNPVVSVTPSSLDFGVIASGTTKDLTFVVRNGGGGLLTGAATVSSPFAVVSGASYSLGSNQSQTVTVRYNPAAAGSHIQLVTFTGGGGATATVSGAAFALLPGLSFDSYAGTISPPFTTNSGGYISQLGETSVTTGGQAVYGFSVPTTGSYVVQINVNAPDESANSLFLNFDDQPTDPAMVWDIPVTSGFANQTVAWRGNGTFDNPQYSPAVFNLTAGPHQLIVRGREGGVQLGRISIAPVGDAPNPPQNLRVTAAL